MASSSLQPLFVRAQALLERGRGADASSILAPALRSSALTRDDELALRALLAEAWLQQDDLDQAAMALGRTPDALRETVSAGRVSTLWRLHGRLASARGDQSRAIAMHGRALKHAEVSHDTRLIGLAHYELAQCYRQVGDVAIVREHITKAASALNAAGDRRHLALVHNVSGVSLAHSGRLDEAMSAFRHAERLAALVHANDVVATVYGNQAIVARIEHGDERALTLAERSVSLHEAEGSGHGLAVALATLGQICVRLGDLERAERSLHRALEVRSPIQFNETTGAVFDTLAQIHLIRGQYDTAAEFLSRASDAYGAYGSQTSRWYEWNVRALSARLALRRGAHEEALAGADDLIAAGAPASDALLASLIAADALMAAGRLPEAGQRLATASEGLDPASAPAAWGEFLRLRGSLHVLQGAPADAYHDFAQSVTLLELIGERYQAALSQLALGRLVAGVGARSAAERHLSRAAATFTKLGAERDLADTQSARAPLSQVGTGENVMSPAGADDAVVRRIVDAAALPDPLARETSAAMLEAAAADAVVLYLERGDEITVLAHAGHAGSDEEAARALVRTYQATGARSRQSFMAEPLGR